MIIAATTSSLPLLRRDAMLRATLKTCAVGTYSLFMIEQKHNPKFAGLPVGKRGRLTAKLYRALSPTEFAALQRRAAKRPAFKRKIPARVKRPRKPSKYALFVKKHYHDAPLTKLTVQQKLKAIGKLWRAQQGTVARAPPSKKASARGKVKGAASTSKAAKGTSGSKKKSKKPSADAPLKLRLPALKKAKNASSTKKKKVATKSRSLVKGGVLLI